MSDLKDLSREYATLVPDWQQPGMRCIDPETGAAYRKMQTGLTLEYIPRRFRIRDDKIGRMARAISAGPDLDDAATVGALWIGLSDHVLTWESPWSRVDYHEDGWLNRRYYDPPFDGPTRAKAVILGCIAQAKDRVTP